MTTRSRPCAVNAAWTQAGGIIEQIVRTRLDSAVSVGMIASGYSVTVPASRDQEASDRAARHFADVTFNATYTGAINTIEVRGVVAA